MYNVYSTILNGNTKNYDGLEWIIDGEKGRRNYPGTFPQEYCERLYKKGISWESILKEYHKGNFNKYFELLAMGNM